MEVQFVIVVATLLTSASRVIYSSSASRQNPIMFFSGNRGNDSTHTSSVYLQLPVYRSPRKLSPNTTEGSNLTCLQCRFVFFFGSPTTQTWRLKLSFSPDADSANLLRFRSVRYNNSFPRPLQPIDRFCLKLSAQNKRLKEKSSKINQAQQFLRSTGLMDINNVSYWRCQLREELVSG